MFCFKDTVVWNKTIENVTNRQYICRKIRLKCHVIAFSTNPTKWEELKNSKSEHAWCNCLHVCTAKVWNVRWLANLWRNVYLTPEHMSPTRHGVLTILLWAFHEIWLYLAIANFPARFFAKWTAVIEGIKYIQYHLTSMKKKVDEIKSFPFH